VSEPASTPTVSSLGALRGFGVMLGGSLALGGASLASVAAAVKALRAGRRPGIASTAGMVATALYALKVRPWMLRWGATRAEREATLQGDEIAPRPGVGPTRAVTVDAPAEAVWPWLAQVGQDRGGFYSYEWLENLAGCRMRNAARIHPEWQRREIGETVLLHPAFGLKVARFDQGRALVLDGWGAFAIEPLDAGRARLLARGHAPAGRLAKAYGLLIEIPHFVMERRMLLGIKERAERTHAPATSATG
jgi:hypothetical protein